MRNKPQRPQRKVSCFTQSNRIASDCFPIFTVWFFPSCWDLVRLPKRGVYRLMVMAGRVAGYIISLINNLPFSLWGASWLFYVFTSLLFLFLFASGKKYFTLSTISIQDKLHPKCQQWGIIKQINCVVTSIFQQNINCVRQQIKKNGEINEECKYLLPKFCKHK